MYTLIMKKGGRKMKLDLDFSIGSSDDRAKFVSKYLKSVDPTTLTDTNLELIGTYILWGKDSDGFNAKQKKLVQLKSKYSTWDHLEIASLDQLQENPTFNEAELRPITDTPLIKRKASFSRTEARQFAPPEILSELEKLWREIDRIELGINYWEIEHKKRTKPPREALLKRFSSEEAESIRRAALKLNQYSYLKQRHLLVVKRTEQYSYQNSWTRHIQKRDSIPVPEHQVTPIFGDNVDVLPAGFKTESALSKKIFPEAGWPIPNFEDEELRRLSDILWTKSSTPRYLDFSDEKNVAAFLKVFEDIHFDLEDLPFESTMREVFDTFEWYVERAGLTDTQKEILDMKIRHEVNDKIAEVVNQKYQKSYGSNYISTIFHKRIVPAIVNAARLHREILENCAFPENFKKCKDCGQILLISPELFMRKSQSKDGFSHYCKKCDKIRRNERYR